ncbi:putative membrane-bound protein [Bacillus phage vB_BsuM-Goe10]|nr:putative membrane-bound protein [Bacillus phage vB_BsuM-Goe10]
MMDLFFKLKVIDQILEWAIPLLVILTMIIWVLVKAAIETHEEKKTKRNKRG